MTAVTDELAGPLGTPLVLCVVGTDHHPFDRLIQWMDRWAAEHRGQHCLVQYGTSQRPQICAGVDYIGHGDLQVLMQRAAAVISHGGPGTIMEIRSVGLQPIVVPRDPARGEHVDGHQQRFVRLLAARGLVESVDSPTRLDETLATVLSQNRSEGQPDGLHVRGAAAAHTFGDLVEPYVRRARGLMP